MATVQNRSPYVISVARHPELTRKFSFSQLKAAKAYMQEMQAQHCWRRPKIDPSVRVVPLQI